MKKARIASLFLTTAVLASSLALPTNASYCPPAVQKYGASFFKEDVEWEKTRTYYKGSTKIGTMIYGFDTDWTDEDYCWTMATECYSTSRVFRDGYDVAWQEDDPDVEKNKWSETEITHRTYYVKYLMNFSASYTGSGITFSETNSSVHTN